MLDFESVYQQLNTEQKTAVDTIDGPLLVLAGPGTGKTQLLSARVANILKKTDTNPSNIVCLTFTVNAANNMRERLRKMIGPSANQVIIKTFHSLAADIITNNSEYFYAGAIRNPVSELASQEMILSLLEKLPHDNPLATKYDGRYSQLENIIDAISRAKDAGLSPIKLKEAIKIHRQDLNLIEPNVVDLLSKTLSNKSLQNLADECGVLASKSQSVLLNNITRLICDAVEHDLPTGKTTVTGKLKSKLLSSENGQKVMAREHKANNWWTALAALYDDYQAMLYKRGYLDYSDMLIGVIEALENNSDLRLDIQESMHYILIDEFQDSNEAQIRFMHLLADNPHIESPNLMVVGDPNQTIYGFNGAMLDNTTDFKRFYSKHLNTVDLTKNYRSSQIILDESHKVIEPFSMFHPDLSAVNEPTASSVSYSAYSTEADQAVSICQIIQEIFNQNSQATIAILARGHKSLTYISRYLIANGLTVNYEQNIDIRSTACNKLIINALGLIHSISNGDKNMTDYYLSILLRHPAFELDPSITWKIALESNRTNNWLNQAAEDANTKSIVDWLHNLTSFTASEPLHVIIEQLLSLEFAPGKTLYQKFYEGNTSEQNIIEAQATRQLIELAKQYAQTDHVNLRSFLEMVDSTSNKLFMFSPSTGHYKHAVTLMSVHGAKGLEFDHVFVIDLEEGNWKPKAARYPTPLSLPIHINLDSAADYARLLYVAMTRARQGLYMSYVTRIDSKTTALPAEQLAQIEFTQVKNINNENIAKSEIAQLISFNPRPKNLNELLSDRLNNYTLSATHFTNFLDLTRRGMDTFIEENIVRFPQPSSEAMAHGIAMHAAMELAQIQTTNDAFDFDAIKRLYEYELRNSNLTSSIVDRLISKAHSQLDVLFNQIGIKFDPRSKPEQSFSANLVSGASLYGKIDRIDTVDDNKMRIVDYKTGKVLENPNSKSQETLLKQWRHRMQLGFYILLVKQHKSFSKFECEAQILQMDATKSEHLYLTYKFTDEELQRIANLATIIFKRIKNLDLPDVSIYEPTLEGIAKFEDDLLS